MEGEGQNLIPRMSAVCQVHLQARVSTRAGSLNSCPSQQRCQPRLPNLPLFAVRVSSPDLVTSCVTLVIALETPEPPSISASLITRTV